MYFGIKIYNIKCICTDFMDLLKTQKRHKTVKQRQLQNLQNILRLLESFDLPGK